MKSQDKDVTTPAASPLPERSIAVGDCIQTMNAWPAGSLDLIFADPPYNIGYTYDQYEDKRSDEDYVQWTCDWVDACTRLLKPSGSFYILIGDEYAAETRVHLKKLEREKKLSLRNWIIWHYTFGQNTKVMFNRSHAHLFYCVGPGIFEKGLGQKTKGKLDPDALPFTFNRKEVAVPSARMTTYGDKRANPIGKLPDDTWYLRPQSAIDAGEAYFDPTCDTWNVSRLCGTFKERVAWHPCQLPEALLERIIKLSSNEGDTVFDPFTGSGTTLAVAARLKRSWLGCELSEDYAAKALERVRYTETTGQTLIQSDEEKGVDRTVTKKRKEPQRSEPPKRGEYGLFAEAK
ncbi:MAG: DNA methyltransferase [Phycisphaeraceae bacterium]